MTSFRYSCLIPFHLADPAGILFFGHVFTLAHQAFEHFVIEELECPWSNWFQNPEWIVPIKHAEAEYFHPLLAGQECHIDLMVTHSSSSSFSLTSSFHQTQLCCTVKTVHVFCNRQTKQKMAIPAIFHKINIIKDLQMGLMEENSSIPAEESYLVTSGEIF